MIDVLTRDLAATDGAAVLFLLDIFLKATLLIVAAWLATSLARQSSAAVRHRIWGLAFAGLLLLPVPPAFLPGWRLPIVPALGNTQTASPSLSPQVQRTASRSLELDRPGMIPDLPEQYTELVPPIPAHSSSTSRSANAAAPDASGATEEQSEPPSAISVTSDWAVWKLSWQTWIVVLWVAGLAGALVPIAVGLIRNRSVGRRARPVVDSEQSRLLAGLQRELRVRRAVRLLEAEGSLVPMTWGVLRPTVLLPAAWRGWTAQRQRIVLLHELAHVKRWDMQFQLLARMTCAMYWFHPLVWYSLQRLRAEREMACDDCVLMAGERPTDYARHLVELARDCRALAMPAALAMAQPSGLERRVRALLDQTRSHLPVSRVAGGLLLVCAAILSAAAAMVGVATTAELQSQATWPLAEPRPGVVEALARQPSVTLFRHTAPVWFVGFASDGRTLVSASRDGTVKTWMLPHGAVRTTLEAIEKPTGSATGGHQLYAAALSSDGRMLATTGSDPTITLWDVRAAKKLRTCVGHVGAVLSVAFSPDDKLLVSGGMDRIVRVWDTATGEQVHDGYGGNAFRNLSVAFSPDGETIVSGCRGNSVKLWEAHEQRYRASFPPDGAPLALACGANDQGFAVGVDHGHIALCTREPEGDLRRRVLEGHRGDVTAVAFTPNGRLLASSGLDGRVKFWDVATGQPLASLPANAGGSRCLAISADGKFLACGGEDHKIHFWDITKLRGVSPPKPPVPLIPEAVRPLRPARLESVPTARIKMLGGVFLGKGSGATWSPDAKRVAFGKSPPEGGIAIVDLKTGKESTLVDVGRDPAWSPKERDLIAYARGMSGAEEIWVARLSGGQPQRICAGTFPAWSAEGKTLCFMDLDGTLKAMPWRAAADTSAIKTIASKVGPHPAVSPDGTQVAYFGDSGFLNLLDRPSGKVTVVRSVPGNGEGLSGRSMGFARWSPDGRQIACGGVDDGVEDYLGLWILDPTGVPPMHVVRGKVNRPAWSPDGSKLAVELTLPYGNEIWMLSDESLAPLRAFHAAHHPKGNPAHLDLKTPFHPNGKLTPLDLESLEEQTAAVALGNPFDQLPGLPRGEQVLAGVKFKIGSRPIQLGNEYLPMGPNKVEGIPVHRAVGRLFVLHGNGVGDSYTGYPRRTAIADYRPLPSRSSAIDALPDGTTIGYYRVRYEDGSDQWIAIVEGDDVRDWCSWNPVSPTRGTIAWKTFNDVTEDRAKGSGRPAQPFALFAGGWQNPHPERKVATIDYLAAGTSAAPFCVAITVEEPAANDP